MKLTNEIAQKILTERILGSSELELKAIFELMGFKLKEFKAKDDQYCFEVHYKREYIIKARISKDSYLVSFSNEFVSFGDTSGVSMGVKTTTELIRVVLNVFVESMRIRYDGVIWNEDSEYTEDEMRSLVDFINPILFK